MAKVIKVFRERFENFKRYNVGDDYPETNKERVKYLVSQGYLEDQSFEPAGVVPDSNIETVEEGETIIPLSETKKTKRRKRGADTDGDPDA